MVEPIYIFGPCAAESEQQLCETAQLLQTFLPDTPFIYRAGAWKPRTSPNSFQGAGSEALVWLQRVREQFGLSVATEVATPEHVHEALRAGIDYLWLGARTTANPIAVQAIADALHETLQQGLTCQGLFVKNPVNEDVQLWLGDIERLETVLGRGKVMAIHRGCNHRPCWSMPYRLRMLRPDMPVLLDPSHMAGQRDGIAPLVEQANRLQLDGLMVEVHPCPDNALSDSQQQLTPAETASLILSDSSTGRLRVVYESSDPRPTHDRSTIDTQEQPKSDPRATQGKQQVIDGLPTLDWLRCQIDEVDNELLTLLAQRMQISREIGDYKRENHIPALQPARYEQLLHEHQLWAEQHQLDSELVKQVWDAIHAASLKQQE